MRDGRVDVYDSKCRCVKHRHHRHASSRMCLEGSRVTFTKALPGGVLSADNGAAPPPPRRAHDIFAAEVLKVS